MVDEVTMFRTAQGKLFEDRAEADAAERLANLSQLLHNVGYVGGGDYDLDTIAAYLLDNFYLVDRAKVTGDLKEWEVSASTDGQQVFTMRVTARGTRSALVEAAERTLLPQ